MKLTAVRELFHKELQALYPREEVETFFGMLLEHHLGVNRFLLVAHPDYRLGRGGEQPFFEALSRLKEEYPIQYILGKADFMELELKVKEGVLIPRPETRDLVEWILESRSEMPGKPDILDIGTGSGCIAIALAYYWKEARVMAMDLSETALEVAAENARNIGVQIEFIKKDILDGKVPAGTWDLLVSNPPYVRQQEKEAMAANVKKYEPELALFVPEGSPLIYYDFIASQASRILRPSGWLYFEINQYLAPEMEGLMHRYGFTDIQLKKDMFGNHRMIRGRQPGVNRSASGPQHTG